MTDPRWAVERAVVASSLPAPSRLIMHTLLTKVSRGTLSIPAEFSPSLTTVAKWTGLSRRAVMDHMKILEAGGWITRDRPDVVKARTEHATTAYELSAPASALASAGDAPALEQEAHQASARDALGEQEDLFAPSAGDALGQEARQPSARGAHNPKSSSPTEKKTAKGGVGGGKSGSRRQRATAAPDDFPITDDMRSWARSKNITVDLEYETERFLNHHGAKGNDFVDWVRAWRNWITGAQNPPWARTQSASNAQPTSGPRATGGPHTEEDMWS